MSLIKRYNLDRYFIDLFKKDDNTIIDINLLDSLESQLNTLEYPREIVDILQEIDSIKEIIIYDLNNNILLHSINGKEDNDAI
jgi:hypothetical protein